MKYYVVLDTNVVVSALFNLSSVPGIILQEALVGRVTPRTMLFERASFSTFGFHDEKRYLLDWTRHRCRFFYVIAMMRAEKGK